MKRLFNILAGLSLLSLLVACGSSGDTTSAPAAPSMGVFLDSAVEGIQYRTATQSGKTTAKGEFSYYPGESVTFSIGSVELPAVLADVTITPLSIAKTTDVNNQLVSNIVVFLQSLDADGNPANGIIIPTSAAAAATTPINFDVTTTAFATNTAVSTLVANSGSTNKTLVAAATAVAHFQGTLAAAGIASTATQTASTATTTTTTPAATTTPATTTTVLAEYPSGVAMASPTSMVTSSGTVTASLPLLRRIGDWGRAMLAAIQHRDGAAFRNAALAAVPLGNAYAAAKVASEAQTVAAFIDDVANGKTVPTSDNLDLTAFFNNGANASCYAPRIAYANHDDAAAGSGLGNGSLPAGDTGMMEKTDNATLQPCSAAQLNALIDPVKKRANAALIIAAYMRASASSSMPAEGKSDDHTTGINTWFQDKKLFPQGVKGSVDSATIAKSSGTYTYLVVASATDASGIKYKLLVKMAYKPSSTASAQFTGIATYVTYTSKYADGNDVACLNGVASVNTPTSWDNTKIWNPTALTGTAGEKVQVGTLRFQRSAVTKVDLTSREATYCLGGGPDNINAKTDPSAYFALTSDNDLDQGVNFTSKANGWIQQGRGFTRYGASFNPSTGEGNYKFAWQAGVQDSHARMFVASVAYNSQSDTRTGQAAFGFSGPMKLDTTDATPTDLKGMICNWAGPGSQHNPGGTFQYQRITLAADSSTWAIDSGSDANKIDYAPVNTCGNRSGSTMTFTPYRATTAGAEVSVGQRSNRANGLDTIDTGKTVQKTIEGRGISAPSYF